jgi:hypothetical protein
MLVESEVEHKILNKNIKNRELEAISIYRGIDSE